MQTRKLFINSRTVFSRHILLVDRLYKNSSITSSSFPFLHIHLAAQQMQIVSQKIAQFISNFSCCTPLPPILICYYHASMPLIYSKFNSVIQTVTRSSSLLRRHSNSIFFLIRRNASFLTHRTINNTFLLFHMIFNRF